LDCETARTLINAYIDGELDLAAGLEVEQHVRDCPDCARAYRRQMALHSALAAADGMLPSDMAPAPPAPSGADAPNRAPGVTQPNGSRQNHVSAEGKTPQRTTAYLGSAGDTGGLYYRAPAGLRARLQAELRRAERAGTPAGAPLRPATGRISWPSSALRGSWLPAGALLVVMLALVAVVAWALAGRGPGSASTDLIAQEVVAGDMRALISGHLTDVASSDQHTVKPWFAGKLDFSPPVVDLAGQGYPLAGGRVDYVDGRPVAALVYRHNQHVINLFVWPAAQRQAAGAQAAVSPTSPQASTYQGENLLHWDQAGMTFWAISDMDPAELRQFAGLLGSAIPAPPVH
jgi:anti-sigma factor RsiW